MNVVYIVTSGDYSDYKIRGVYSTKELAEEAKTLLAADNDVEAWELDRVFSYPTGMIPYRIFMRLDTGDTKNIWRIPIDEVDEYDFTQSNLEEYNGLEEKIGMAIWAKNEKHALQIANDKRIAIKLGMETYHLKLKAYLDLINNS